MFVYKKVLDVSIYMKSKKIIFSILEKIEKIKSEKELIKIKYTKEKNKQTILCF